MQTAWNWMRRRVTWCLTKIQAVWYSVNIFTNFERHWSTLKIKADKKCSRRQFIGGLWVNGLWCKPWSDGASVFEYLVMIVLSYFNCKSSYSQLPYFCTKVTIRSRYTVFSVPTKAYFHGFVSSVKSSHWKEKKRGKKMIHSWIILIMPEIQWLETWELSCSWLWALLARHV